MRVLCVPRNCNCSSFIGNRFFSLPPFTLLPLSFVFNHRYGKVSSSSSSREYFLKERGLVYFIFNMKLLERTGWLRLRLERKKEKCVSNECKFWNTWRFVPACLPAFFPFFILFYIFIHFLLLGSYVVSRRRRRRRSLRGAV